MAVVVGLVATAEGRAALRRAARECRERSAELVVVEIQQTAGAVDQREADAARQELQLVQTDLTAAGIPHLVRTADPDQDLADALLAVDQEGRADLIVVGLRRRSPVGKLILGSNAQRVLLDAHCPVLTVKAES